MAPTKKLSPDTAKVSTDRLTKGGKCGNKRKNRNSVSKTLKNSFNLCTHTYPFRLAKLNTSLAKGKASHCVFASLCS